MSTYLKRKKIVNEFKRSIYHRFMILVPFEVSKKKKHVNSSFFMLKSTRCAFAKCPKMESSKNARKIDKAVTKDLNANKSLL